MKIFERPKQEFCKNCKFSFIREKQLFCAKTINITHPENNCQLFEEKINKKYED